VLEGLTVRPITAADGPLLQEIFGDPAVAEWLRPAGEHGGYSAADAEHTAAADAAHWFMHGYGMWIALDGEQPIARVGLVHRTVRRRAEVELAWAVRADRWGQGVATGLARRALNNARQSGIDGVVAITREDNARSRGVMDKLGMRLEAHFEHAGYPHVLCRAPD
jgi:RimJ/RimL family protein N-acetyltransferase